MKPFEVGKTYPSRDGERLYTVVADGLSGNDWMLATYVTPNNGFKLFQEFNRDGEDGEHRHRFDMVHRTVKREGWMAPANVQYPHPSVPFGAVYHSEEEAAKKGLPVIRIEWEEEE